MKRYLDEKSFYKIITLLFYANAPAEDSYRRVSIMRVLYTRAKKRLSLKESARLRSAKRHSRKMDSAMDIQYTYRGTPQYISPTHDKFKANPLDNLNKTTLQIHYC